MKPDVSTPKIISSSEDISKLLTLAHQAYKHVPFYRTNFAHIDFHSPFLQLLDLPLLNKEQARHASSYLTRQDYIEGQPGTFVDYTSGSAGIPLRLVHTRTEYMRVARSLWQARLELFPDVTASIGVTVYPMNQSPERIGEINRKSKLKLLSTVGLRIDNVEFYLDLLDNLKPTWLNGPPALLAILAEGMRRKNRCLRAKLAFVESNGDCLNPEIRNLLAETFNCRIINHYGCQETYTIAYECHKGKMHVFNDCVLAELHPDPETEEMELIVSSLIFEMTPFIRYRIGDFVSLDERECSCGKNTPVFSTIKGRIGDFISGTTLPGNYIFSRVMEQVIENLNIDCILQYKAIQVSLNDFEVQLVLNNQEYFKEISAKFRECASAWLPDASFSFKSLDQIELTQRGKTQIFLPYV